MTTTRRRSTTRSRRSAPRGRRSARAPPPSSPSWGAAWPSSGATPRCSWSTMGDGERAVAYAQFGPLSAYPRALRLRELYPRLPQSPLPAVITCVAVAAEAPWAGLGAGPRRGDLRGPRRSRLRGRRGLPGDRAGPGRHLGRHAGVLGAGRLRGRGRRRALPGGAPRALTGRDCPGGGRGRRRAGRRTAPGRGVSRGRGPGRRWRGPGSPRGRPARWSGRRARPAPPA